MIQMLHLIFMLTAFIFFVVSNTYRCAGWNRAKNVYMYELNCKESVRDGDGWRDDTIKIKLLN